MKRLLFATVLLCSALIAKGQSPLSSNIDVKIDYVPLSANNIDNQTKVKYAPIYPYLITVEQIVTVNELTDTLVLNLPYTSMLNQIIPTLLFNNFIVEAKADNQGQYKSAPYIFDGIQLKCAPNFKAGKLKIRYNYQSDFAFTKDPLHSSAFMVPQIYGWHSWYFASKDMTLDRVTFSTPPQAYFWGSGTRRVADDRYVVDASDLNSDISFYLLDKDYYTQHQHKMGGRTINMLFTKGFVFDTTVNDSSQRLVTKRPASNSPLIDAKQVLPFVKNALTQLGSIFGSKKTDKINIADAFLSITMEGESPIVWGNSTKCGDDEHLILIDTSSWTTSVLIHELAHTFGSNPPAKTDSTHYFFAESMIEYIATHIANADSLARDAAFAKKGKIADSASMSIFKITQNSTSQEGGNTSEIIYNTVPYAIDKLAKSIGRQKFIAILTEFYAKPEQNWARFESLIKSHGGVSDLQWSQFVATI